MDQRAQYLIQILEKIGAPLLVSVLEGLPQGDPSNIQREAQIIAELLGKTVHSSIELGRIIDISALGDRGDSMRLALAGIAGPLIASLFRRTGAPPDDVALKKTIAALESVLSFSENFAPEPDNIQRLKDLQAQGQGTDKYQIYVQYMNAFIPVLNAISNFTFGQNEQKLVMEVSSKLSSRAADIRKAIFDAVDPAYEKLLDLAILKTLAEIYSACHLAETRRISKLSDEERMAAGGLSMAPVWQLFEQRVAVLEALTQNILPPQSGTGQGASQGTSAVTPPMQTAPPAAAAPVAPPPVFTAPPAAPPVSPPPSAAPQIFQAKPVTPPAPPPPVAPTAAPLPPMPEAIPSAIQAVTQPPQPPAGAAGNPMSLFAKKPAGDAAPTPPPSSAQTAAPPPLPPIQPAAQQPAAAEKKNPMSFFKPGTQKSDD